MKVKESNMGKKRVAPLKKGKKVLMAFSGGVDSSVGVYLLQKQGYEITGAFMKNWSDTKNKITGECQWREERRVAIHAADILGIDLLTFDFEDVYKKDVIDVMFKEYEKGKTPNPDVDCNQKIKFPLFWKKAKKLGYDYMATGHYIRRLPVHDKSDNYKLLRATCERKDQSYFLYRIKQEEIETCLFPIGYYTKDEVRAIAKKIKLPNFDKKGTKGICFVGKVNLKDFLKQKILPKKGPLLTPEGDKLGEHDGIMYYTIGQRIGPRYGIDFKRKAGKQSEVRWYIADKILKGNKIIVAPDGHPALFRKDILVKGNDFHFISSDKKIMKEKLAKKNKKVFARIRHVGELQPCLFGFDGKDFTINLSNAIMGVAPGQSVVLYEKDEVIGGGEIVFPK
ncbi:MAG: tRNA 2-thiouridine(34) synthase MnmA [Nanoarchaeota archaeon]|nr:tRNA 2-thiouridine(34) synthase MnmA [Nanoarchaeota archaeon]